jgi:hypothetical protein
MSVKERDGHMINQQFEQERILSETMIRNVYCDLGYCGADVDTNFSISKVIYVQ